MSSFESTYIPSNNRDAGAAIVVYGLDPIPGQLDRTIAALAETNDVFTYTYSREVVASGDPQALPDIISVIRDDIKDKTSSVDPERIHMAGASLGAFVAYNIQKQLSLPLTGLYATAGINMARNLFLNPIFYSAKRTFKQNGVELSDLQRSWRDIDIYKDEPATVPGVCAISRFDPVVPYVFAARNLKSWQESGAPVKVLSNSVARFEGRLLHSAAINYFDSTIREIIEISKTVKAN